MTADTRAETADAAEVRTLAFSVPRATTNTPTRATVRVARIVVRSRSLVARCSGAGCAGSGAAGVDLFRTHWYSQCRAGGRASAAMAKTGTCHGSIASESMGLPCCYLSVFWMASTNAVVRSSSFTSIRFNGPTNAAENSA